jgi:hypothetical protein
MIKFINRDLLYHQVWLQPMTKLSQKYNLSTSDLKKICDSVLIPLPKAGYWSKIKFGKKVTIPDLPLLSNKLKHIKYKKLSVTDSTKLQIRNTKNIKIRVKQTLLNPHPLIAKTRTTLKTIKIDDYGMKKVIYNGINLRVSKVNENRALRIMDSVFKWFEKNGATISYPYKNNTDTYVIVDNEEIKIFIEEKSKYIGMIEKRYGSYTRIERGYKPTGILSLGINPYCYWGCGLRKTWSDGKTGKLEDKVHEFIHSVYKHAELMKVRTLERKMENEAREKAFQEQKYIQKCKELEEKMIEELSKQSKDFFESQKIYSYIHEVRKSAKLQYSATAYPQELTNWIEWATNYAKNLNPISNSLPSYISATTQLKI